MKYAILAYNHSIHSATKFKPIDIINGHINNEDPFNINLDQMLMSNYVTEHKDRTKLLYSDINERLAQTKEKVIGKINETRDDPSLFEPNKEVYVKEIARQKSSNKFKPLTSIKAVDPIRKTLISKEQKKIHMDNVKRPFRNRYSFESK